MTNKLAIVADLGGALFQDADKETCVSIDVFGEQPWSPLAEIFEETDCLSIASSFFPDDLNQKYPIFYLGPRMILAQYLRIAKENGASNTDLFSLSRLGLSAQKTLLEGSIAYQFVDVSEKMATQILSNLREGMTLISQLPAHPRDCYFSFNDWARDPQKKSLYLPYTKEQAGDMARLLSVVGNLPEIVYLASQEAIEIHVPVIESQEAPQPDKSFLGQLATKLGLRD